LRIGEVARHAVVAILVVHNREMQHSRSEGAQRVFTLGGRVQHAYRSRLTREAARICLLGAGLLLASLAPAAAQDPHAEIFTGLDASNNATTGYLGAGYAFGKGLYAPGWRVRAVGSLGRYDYRGTLFGGGSDLGTSFDGDASYGAALLGYQFRADALIVKLFAGVEAEDQSISPRDPANAVQGSAVGLKLVMESWLDVSPLWFLSADAAYGTAFQQYWSLARVSDRVSRSGSKAALSAMRNMMQGAAEDS
jgi:hypothetical protein